MKDEFGKYYEAAKPAEAGRRVTRASTFHRYAVEVSPEDELLLKSSDIGNWLIGKHGGRWRVYVRENGELRCINNEILKEERSK